MLPALMIVNLDEIFYRKSVEISINFHIFYIIIKLIMPHLVVRHFQVIEVRGSAALQC